MSVFPAIEQILDPLNGTVGGGAELGAPNWAGPALDAPTDSLYLNAGGGCVAKVNGTISGSYWTQPVAVFAGAFAQFLDPPTSVNTVIKMGAASARAVAGTSGFLGLEYDADVGNADGIYGLQWGSAEADYTGPPINAGDWIGVGYNPGTGLLTAYHRSAGTTAWASVGTTTVDDFTVIPGNTAGYRLFLETNDSTQRICNLGGSVLPGANPTLTAPQVHGRGAC